MKWFKSLAILLLIAGFGSNLVGQDLQGSLSKFLEDNAKSYIQPVMTGFGTSMNSALYKKANCKTGLIPPFGFDAGIAVSISVVPDADMSFVPSLTENTITFDLGSLTSGQINQVVELPFEDLYSANQETTPTIAAATDEKGMVLQPKSSSDIFNTLASKLSASDADKLALMRSAVEQSISNTVQPFAFPDGLGASLVPAAALQANIRLPFGIEISGRGLPVEMEVPNVGKFTMYGLGVRKSLPVPIFDVTVGGMYQQLTLGDMIESTNMNYHAEIGKSLGIPGFKISPYVGAGMDNTSVTLKYDFIDSNTGETIPINFDFKGDNGMRLNAGVSLQLPLLYLHAEVSQGTYQSASLSAGFIFK